MFFDTPIYFIFLTAVVAIYWRLRWRAQNLLLLVASYFFYGWWDWRFLGLILISTVVDFFCSHAIGRSDSPGRRKALLLFSVSLNLGFLGFFKYFNFFVDSFVSSAEALGISVSIHVMEVLLPPGISFYTFQAVAYIVDVYYKRVAPARSFVDYALFISLFPHLIAGPIQRPSHLLPQVQAPRVWDSERVMGGLSLIASGLFRKCVIADNCGLLADGAFDGKLGPANVWVLAIGTYAFAWQIYGDFSGYSNIARGSGQLLGFHFMVNFRQPYLATSLRDFWRRWHISLSTWLRDYLYVSLGGNREGRFLTYRNLMATMVIGGLWHGANWTFAIWGALHGAVLSLERMVMEVLPASWRTGLEPGPAPVVADSWLGKWGKRVLVFHVVCLGWIFFRSKSAGEAYLFLHDGLRNAYWMPEYVTAIKFLTLFTVPLFAIDLLNERRGEEYLTEHSHPFVRVAMALLLVGATLSWAGNKANAFIYFQF